MSDFSYKGMTSRPVIAERRLVRLDSSEAVIVRVHEPEHVEAFPGMPWRCGYSISGLPELAVDPEAGLDIAPGEVLFAPGEDSFDALVLALAGVRRVLDLAEEVLGVEITWPPRADWGHLVPRWVTRAYGRGWERRLLEAMEREEERLVAERAPNPYAWDDPRHPQQHLRSPQARPRSNGSADDAPDPTRK